MIHPPLRAGPLHQLHAAGRRQHDSGGRLVRRSDEHRVGPRRVEQVGADAVRVHRDGRELDPGCGGGGVDGPVARILHGEHADARARPRRAGRGRAPGRSPGRARHGRRRSTRRGSDGDALRRPRALPDARARRRSPARASRRCAPPARRPTPSRRRETGGDPRSRGADPRRPERRPAARVACRPAGRHATRPACDRPGARRGSPRRRAARRHGRRCLARPPAPRRAHAWTAARRRRRAHPAGPHPAARSAAARRAVGRAEAPVRAPDRKWSTSEPSCWTIPLGHFRHTLLKAGSTGDIRKERLMGSTVLYVSVSVDGYAAGAGRRPLADPPLARRHRAARRGRRRRGADRSVPQRGCDHLRATHVGRRPRAVGRRRRLLEPGLRDDARAAPARGEERDGVHLRVR